MKALIPEGFMIAPDPGHGFRVMLCSGMTGNPAPADTEHGAHTAHANHHHSAHNHGSAPAHGDEHESTAGSEPCAFSVLNQSLDGGVDPLLVPAELSFVIETALAPITAPRVRARAFLRPPMRAPPFCV